MEMTLVPIEFYELPLFKTLSRAEVEEIGRLAQPLHFQAGEVIFRERSSANHLDLVWEGSVRITKADRDGADRPIALIQARSVVGEMSLMSGLDRSCTGVAATDVALYRIRREDFVELLDRGSLAAYKVIFNLAQVMSTRLRSVDEKLVDLLGQQPQAVSEEFSEFRQKLFTEWAF
jgi:CRP-like cAMP-binding protein